MGKGRLNTKGAKSAKGQEGSGRFTGYRAISPSPPTSSLSNWQKWRKETLKIQAAVVTYPPDRVEPETIRGFHRPAERADVNRYILGPCIAVLVSAGPICQGQAAASTNKSMTAAAAAVSPAARTSSGTNDAVRRLHMIIARADQSDFLKLVNDRKLAMDDIRVVARLIREKKAALNRVNGDLATGFSIKGNRNYSYDIKTRTIHAIVGSAPDTDGTDAPAAGVASPAATKQVHMVLDSKEQADLFVRLTASKQLVSTVIRVLALLEQVK